MSREQRETQQQLIKLVFSLSKNDIGAEGAKALAEGLKSNIRLTSIKWVAVEPRVLQQLKPLRSGCTTTKSVQREPRR